MDELISRQAAIDALDCINGTEEVLRSLPSVQPERKTGRWVTKLENHTYECSECGNGIITNKEYLKKHKFCFCCGAKMLKDGEGKMTDVEFERRKAICEAANVDDIGEVSDGFHTFDSLYEQRMILFAALVKAYRSKAWKSYRHEDGEYCFGGGWFIVGIDTPEGSYTYHYKNKYWNMFDCVDLPRAPHWDGHTEADAETRLMSLEPEIKTDGDTISRQAAIDALRVAYWDDNIQSAKDDPCIVDAMTDWAIRQVKALPPAQPEIKTDGDTISEHDMADKLTRLINEFEMILSDIREKEVDDSVCGLCEYDADHGIDGYANECLGYEKDDCFRLKDEYRKQWMSMEC